MRQPISLVPRSRGSLPFVIGAAYYGAMSTRTPLPSPPCIAAALDVRRCPGRMHGTGRSAASGSASATRPRLRLRTATSTQPVAPRDEPSPSAETPISAPGCDSFLTEEQTPALAAEGFVPDPTSTWPDVMAEAAAAGGTWCAWTSR